MIVGQISTSSTNYCTYLRKSIRLKLVITANFCFLMCKTKKIDDKTSSSESEILCLTNHQKVLLLLV